MHLWLTVPGVPPPGLQPHKTSRVATLPEAMRVLDSQYIGGSDQVSHTLHLLEQRRFRIRLLGHFFDPPIVFLDAFIYRFHLSQQRLQGFPQPLAQSTHGLSAELLRATLAQPFTVGLHQSPCGIHQSRSRTHSTARARISVRCNCAWALRCFTGLSSSGSIRASRASVRASRRSSFRRLLVIKRTFCACPTITSCPSAVNSRLTQGECVPVSIAMRHRGMLPNTCFIASGVVASLCSKMISPASFKTQYALERSPRSNPMVSCPWKMFFPLVRIVLIFCIAGLLFIVLRARSNIGSLSHPVGDRPSHPNLVNELSGQYVMVRQVYGNGATVEPNGTQLQARWSQDTNWGLGPVRAVFA